MPTLRLGDNFYYRPHDGANWELITEDEFERLSRDEALQEAFNRATAALEIPEWAGRIVQFGLVTNEQIEERRDEENLFTLESLIEETDDMARKSIAERAKEMFEILEGKETLIIKNLFKKTYNNIVFQYEKVKYTNKEMPLQDFLDKSMQYFQRHYNVDEIENSFKIGYYGVGEERESVCRLQVTSEMVDNMLIMLNSEKKRWEVDIKQSKANFVTYLKMNDTPNMADRLYHTADRAIRILHLEKLMDQLQQLRNGTIEGVYLNENGTNAKMLTSQYNAYLLKKNGHLSKPEMYQYKMLSLCQPVDNIIKFCNTEHEIITIYTRNKIYNPSTGCFYVTLATLKKDQNVEPVKELSLEQLYPNVDRDTKQIADSGWGFRSAMDNLIRIDMGYMCQTFVLFNIVKNKLMFTGASEVEAVDYIMNKTRYTVDVPAAFRGHGVCEITNQVIPNVFLVPCKLKSGKVVTANAWYLNQCNTNLRSGDRNKQRYKLSSNGEYYVETNLAEHEYFWSLKFSHNYNILNYLSPRYLKNQHVKPYTPDKGYRPTPYLGVELEVEQREGYASNADGTIKLDSHGNAKPLCSADISEQVINELTREFVMFKHDGSLGGQNPFEIVTVPATLEYQKKAWKSFMDNKELKQQLQSYASGRCGIHVHISRDSFTGLHLAKFMRFLNHEDNHPFIAAIAQRKNGFNPGTGRDYCQYRPKETIAEAAKKIKYKTAHHGDVGDSHYQAINTENDATVEVRIFRGNLGKTQFYKALEFVHAVWAYTLESSMNELNYKDFLQWLFDPAQVHHKLYNHLERWLIASNFNVSNVTIKQDTPESVRTRLKEKRAKVKKIQESISRRFLEKDKKKAPVKLETNEELLQSA